MYVLKSLIIYYFALYRKVHKSSKLSIIWSVLKIYVCGMILKKASEKKFFLLLLKIMNIPYRSYLPLQTTQLLKYY
jgi:hypothetical protein